jgi:DNA polymerase-3 subunit alpha
LHPILKGPSEIPLDDPKTYDMLGRGETVGVFQLESGGMTRYVAQLKPQSIRELAAMVALFRPGPMEHIPRFIDTKFGRVKENVLHESMRPILEETYGVIVYQDQVLKLVQALAGFTLGKADILRRAMGKKDKAAMDSMHKEFIEGAAKNGITQSIAKKVWELLLPFAGYAFNKAHAVCYAILAYQTAYLKANYPVHYMAALMAVYRPREDRIVTCIEECRRLKISVLPPDVNRSMKDFSIEGVAIRFGLAAIKGFGEGVSDALIRERQENGPFGHLYEFAERMKPFGVTRPGMEALAKAGALDSIDQNRATLLRYIDAAFSYAERAIRDRSLGQNSLFGEPSDGERPVASYPVLPSEEPLSKQAKLAMENEVLGIYVSDHPLRGYEAQVLQASTHRCAHVEELEEGTRVKLAGVISGLRTIITKRTGEKMASLQLEDFSGQTTAIVFAATYAKFKDVMVKDAVVKLSGIVMHRERSGSGGEKSVEVRVEEVQPMDPFLDFYNKSSLSEGALTISISRATKTQLAQIREIIQSHAGEREVFLQLGSPTDTAPLPTLQSVSNSSEFQNAILKVIRDAQITVIGEGEPIPAGFHGLSSAMGG